MNNIKLLSATYLDPSSYVRVRLAWPSGRGIMLVSGLSLTADAVLVVTVLPIQPSDGATSAGAALSFPSTPASGEYTFDLPACALDVLLSSETGTLALGELSVYHVGP